MRCLNSVGDMASICLGLLLMTPLVSAQANVRRQAGQPSPNGQCGVVTVNGASTTYVCGSGSCCSQYGYCGSSAGHCGTGCQTSYGACTGSGSVTTASGTRTSTSSRSSSTSSRSTSTVRTSTTSRSSSTTSRSSSTTSRSTSATGTTTTTSATSATGTIRTTSSATAVSASTSISTSTSSPAAPRPSPINRCGADVGLSCEAGLCCSQYGWCGTSIDHCGANCQLAYGICESTPGGTTSSSSAASSSAVASTASTASAASSGVVTSGAATSSAAASTVSTASSASTVSSAPSVGPSPAGQCGATAGGNSCQPGLCCSQYGWCGTTTDHCGPNCQSPFGVCRESTTTSVTATGTASITPSATPSPGQCGATSKLSCGNSLCCSQFDTCAGTSDACGSGCQSAFGKCGTGETGPKCGPMFGNAACPSGQCCGQNGICGYGFGYCTSPGCQNIYGSCDKTQTPAGPDTANVPRPPLGSLPYGPKIFRCTKANAVAITFDDGPSPFTSDLLTQLKVNNIRATFYVLGKTIDGNPEYPRLIQRMIEDGHQVASHSYTHPDMSLITSAERRQQLHFTETVIARIINKFPTYFRAPYLSCDAPCEADINKLGYHLIDLDYDTKDFEYPNDMTEPKRRLTAKFNTVPTPSNVLSLQHDTVGKSATDLTPYYIQVLKEKNLQGVTVGECLEDPPENWYRTL